MPTIWQPTPVLLPGESHGRRSLVGYSPWGRKESDTTERLYFTMKMSPAEEDGKGRYGASNNPLAAVSKETHRWQGGGFPSITHRARRCQGFTHPSLTSNQGQTQIPAALAPCPVLTPPPASVLLSLFSEPLSVVPCNIS